MRANEWPADEAWIVREAHFSPSMDRSASGLLGRVLVKGCKMAAGKEEGGGWIVQRGEDTHASWRTRRVARESERRRRRRRKRRRRRRMVCGGSVVTANSAVVGEGRRMRRRGAEVIILCRVFLLLLFYYGQVN